MARNFLSEVAAFIRRHVKGNPWSPAIKWTMGKRADGQSAMVLELRDRIPPPAFHPGSALRFEITSEHHRLDSRFGTTAAAINARGAKGHGRVLTCLDRHGQPVAAIGYHLDPDPDTVLLVCEIAALGGSATEEEQELSLVMTGVLLVYLVAAAARRGLPARLGFAPPPDDAKSNALGFEPCKPPAAYADTGTRYKEWSPPAPIA